LQSPFSKRLAGNEMSSYRVSWMKLDTQKPKRLTTERTTMRYRTNHGLLIEAETSFDIVRRLRESSWSEQNLSDQAFMEAVADRMYEQGIHVSTVSPDIFVAGLLTAGLLTREIETARSNETS
jgi:hypothetical protein